MRLHVSTSIVVWMLSITIGTSTVTATPASGSFDHSYQAYAKLLSAHVINQRVNYVKLVNARTAFTTIIESIAAVSAEDFQRWSEHQQLAYWINAYNLFTLKAIVDHYPITGSWLSWYPRNSIKQIEGVWDVIPWHAAGRIVTLDQIEHEIMRPTFKQPLIHFAINCAALSCPPLSPQPYRSETLIEQLATSTRQALTQSAWLKNEERTLRVTAILNWYGEDFTTEYAHGVTVNGSYRDRAILGLIARYGPPAAQAIARVPNTRIRFLAYDWSLNDVTDTGRQ